MVIHSTCNRIPKKDVTVAETINNGIYYHAMFTFSCCFIIFNIHAQYTCAGWLVGLFIYLLAVIVELVEVVVTLIVIVVAVVATVTVCIVLL